MSKLEEIERVIERLPLADFERLSHWMELRSAAIGTKTQGPTLSTRDHRAFLNSYSPEDEGLYDAS